MQFFIIFDISLNLDGYAKNVLNIMRNNEMELPLTLGRDFSGTIIRKGLKVDEKYKVGDKVYGFIPLHKQGSFAEYVISEGGHVGILNGTIMWKNNSSVIFF